MKVKRNNILDKIYWTVFLILAVTAALVIVTTLESRLPLNIYTIKSGSMSPLYSQGSVVAVIKKNEYKVKDVITFRNPDKTTQNITHRISSIEYADDGSEIITTKGDANDTPDSEKITKDNIVGKVTFAIPLIGYLIILFKTKIGIILFVVIPTAIFAVSEIRNISKLIRIYKNGGVST